MVKKAETKEAKVGESKQDSPTTPDKEAQVQKDASVVDSSIEKNPKTKVGGYVVAKGKCISTLTGTKTAGVSVQAKDLSGGQDSFDALIKAGHVKKG